ncbi:MAG: glycosyltransferase [Sphingobium sp.]
MRIVIDLQGAQGSNRHRGIGRYSLSLAKGMARNRGNHEIVIALNGDFTETIEPIRAAFQDLLPPENIFIWHAPAPYHAAEKTNEQRRHAAELVRESALASLMPDYIVVTSVFEGLGDNIVTSIGQLNTIVPTAAVLYDLIPLIHREIYLKNPLVLPWYEKGLSQMRNADLILAISESSRQEAIAYLGASEADAINISCAAEDHFTPLPDGEDPTPHLARRYGLERPFVMYTGGIDFRKNIEGLIDAYAALPVEQRREHQLAIVCSMQDTDRIRLSKLVNEVGLNSDEVIFTGFIPEDDLLACYRSCKLFIFPSWHEGFGLPVLEAMKCGCPVIAGNKSSLPEVVGLDLALFDPLNTKVMSRKIAEVLDNEDMRLELQRHGLKQAEKFSWDDTALRALRAIEASQAQRPQKRSLPVLDRRPRLAFISPLPPEPSGISDYSAELLPDLARHYRIEVIIHQDVVTDPGVLANYPIRDVAWFRENGHKFDRILYHFGNSHFHAHMFELLRDLPGVVVLHDFFLSGIVSFREATGEASGVWTRALLDANGWAAVEKRHNAPDSGDVVFEYPCNLQVLQDALGVIVHADYSRQLAREWYGPDSADDWTLIPLLRQPIIAHDRTKARQYFGFRDDDLVVCSFGFLASTKMNDRLLSAWLRSPLARDPRCHLVFVGQADGGAYGAKMTRAIAAEETAGRVRITGWADTSVFRQWLATADVGVQLRTLSRGETSAAVLDCMNAGLPTIVNANGSMAELPADSVCLMSDNFTEEELVEALSKLWQDKTFRLSLGQKAKAHIERRHQPRRCAQAYADAIEQYYAKSVNEEFGLIKALAESELVLSEHDWAGLSTCISRNLPPRPRLRRILVDVSTLAFVDARTGIQRVVKSILKQWLMHPPTGFIVEPVYAELDKTGYRYARKFTTRFLETWEGWLEDDAVEPYPGDIFIGLDLHLVVVPQQAAVLQEWRQRGVKVRFVVYDLLPVMLPEFFLPEARKSYHNWFKTVVQFDGLICISRSVADECYNFLGYVGPKRERSLAIDWFHLGGNTEESIKSLGLPHDSNTILQKLRGARSFLMVGTIEPRKGHQHILAAFETLWNHGDVVNLVLVGKLGWMMDDFAATLLNHPEFNTRLFWLESVTDEYLEMVYSACHCLIAASEGEGFGLPLVEAAHNGMPVLARDIPVFREVGGAAAAYFPDTNDATVIADAIRRVPLNRPAITERQNTGWISWAQSAETLLVRVLEQDESYRHWSRDGVMRFWGSDVRLDSRVGSYHRREVRTTGEAGYLICGPHMAMQPGTYRLKASGRASRLTGSEHIETTSNSGSKRYIDAVIDPVDGLWTVEEDFYIVDPAADFEIRLKVDAASDMSLETVEIIALRHILQSSSPNQSVSQRSKNSIKVTARA